MFRIGAKIHVKVSLLLLSAFLFPNTLRALSLQDLLHSTAVENLRAAESSLFVYEVYNNFIVPSLCQDPKMAKNPKRCALAPIFNKRKALFAPSKHDPSGIFHKPIEPINLIYSAKNGDVQTGKPSYPAAPKGYSLTHVGCYRREELRNTNSDCSLFFTIAEHPTEAPLFSVKGTSHSEDWGNNLTAGSSILTEITGVFTGVLKGMRNVTIGAEGTIKNDEVSSDEMHKLVGPLSVFLNKISKKSGKIIFTGHSLGGALTQELAREAFIATRINAKHELGPRVRVVTFNGLSYTSMLGRLQGKVDGVLDTFGIKQIGGAITKTGRFLKKLIHRSNEESVTDVPIEELSHLVEDSGWKSKDDKKIEGLRQSFDGFYLSAVNFHTADDILTRIINKSLIGMILRRGSGTNQTHAGDDVLLPTDRDLLISSLISKVKGHGMNKVMYDMLYAVGGNWQITSKGIKALRIQSPHKITQQLYDVALATDFKRKYRANPQSFMNEGRKAPSIYDNTHGLSTDYITAYDEVSVMDEKVEFYQTAFPRSLARERINIGELHTDNDIQSLINAKYFTGN